MHYAIHFKAKDILAHNAKNGNDQDKAMNGDNQIEDHEMATPDPTDSDYKELNVKILGYMQVNLSSLLIQQNEGDDESK